MLILKFYKHVYPMCKVLENQNSIVVKLINQAKFVKWGHGVKTRKFRSRLGLITTDPIMKAKGHYYFCMLFAKVSNIDNALLYNVVGLKFFCLSDEIDFFKRVQ